ncbi:MAG TPA: GntR family transcriptional regulator [Candidatus Limnocylindrales bacterium]|nr:GntR family transcriptional regulator [Candidatus Limnocylindrales bacterium]
MTTAAFVPRYRRIEQALRSRIAGMRPGDPLPSDAELCAEFGVSRMTARNAMQRLAEEGLVQRQPGRGSFVAEPPTHRRANHLMSFSHEMERLGREPTSIVLARELRPATPGQAAELRLRQGDPIVYLQRVRCADGQPIALETAILDRRTAPAVMAADLRTGSLHATLTAGGHQLRRGTATINAAPATGDDARHLGTRAGDPMLVERRVILDAAGRPIEATESRYPADRYALEVWFDVEDDGPISAR